MVDVDDEESLGPESFEKNRRLLDRMALCSQPEAWI